MKDLDNVENVKNQENAGNEENQNLKYLITGAAGFIGSFLAEQLLSQGKTVIGIDNINDYYDISLKKKRLSMLENNSRFKFIVGDISEKEFLMNIFKEERPDYVFNLAAQAGVRYSIENPDVYIQSNIVGFFNILEACRAYPVKHLIYASSSSVYGSNSKVPFEETDSVDHPVSLYAASKKSNELMAYTYSHLFHIPTTGLRFFTVYGPMGRPDMAYFGFTNKFFNDEPIEIYNNGDFSHDLYRDFTYIDDIVEGIVRLTDKPSEGIVPYNIFNIGNNQPVKLMDFITTLEECLSSSLGRKIEFNKIYEPIKPGDVPATYASTDALDHAIGFKPKTKLKDGLQNFTNWYVDYYNRQ